MKCSAGAPRDQNTAQPLTRDITSHDASLDQRWVSYVSRTQGSVQQQFMSGTVNTADATCLLCLVQRALQVSSAGHNT